MYLFRADGNEKIGAGHLMRCLTIAEELAELLRSREKICFCCADRLSAQMVRTHGFDVRVFDTDYEDMMREIPKWQQFNKESNVILIDSYHVTDVYLEALKETGATVLLDDMQRRCFPVDAVINYNAFARQEIYGELYRDRDTICFVGSDYVPIRPQFREKCYRVREQVQDVLITTGGGDVDNIAGMIIKKLTETDQNRKVDKKRRYHLVVGGYNSHMEELEETASKTPDIYLHRDVQDMAGLMDRCDLAVTAGGTTIYELASVGVPFICFSYAENQEQLVHYIREKQIAGYAGDYHKDPQGTLCTMCRLFDDYAADREIRNACYEKERLLVDGKGARRIAEKLLAAI